MQIEQVAWLSTIGHCLMSGWLTALAHVERMVCERSVSDVIETLEGIRRVGSEIFEICLLRPITRNSVLIDLKTRGLLTSKKRQCQLWLRDELC